MLIWRKRIFAKVFLAYSLIIVFCVAVVGGYVVRSEKRTGRRNLEEQLRRIAQLVDDRLGLDVDLEDVNETDAIARRIGKVTRTRVTLIATDGSVVGDTEAKPESMENHRFRPEVQGAAAEGFGSSLRFSATVRAWFLYVAIPSVTRSGWVIRVAMPLEQYHRHLRDSTNAVIIGSVVAALLAIILGLFFTRRITQPLEDMRVNLERLERGEFGVRLETRSDDEVGQLSRTLNRVQEQLEETIQTLTSQRNERDAILASMVEGLLAVDAEDRVLLMNRSALDLLGIPEPGSDSRRLIENVRQPGLVNFVQRVRHSQTPIAAELVMHDPKQRWLELHGAPLYFSDDEKPGAVVVLNDVTRVRKLEQIRKDFVGNVSHELKTPVTTIKGFLETLLQGGALEEPESARRFLGIISKHTERLSAIIDDLLYLSRLEHEEAEIPRHPVNLASVVEASAGNFEHLAGSRSIQLVLQFHDQDPIVLGNPSILMRAIDNLIENAIKYSPQGSEVQVELVREGGLVHLHVRDRGIGIPEEHLPRISERFYRVDTARSRELGGTGLGLAIVKHVALVHGGRLNVESVVGQGSCFTLCLPLSEQPAALPPDGASG